MQHRAVFYSSGVAEFERHVAVAAAAASDVEIRVRTDELADLLASLDVRGAVRFAAVPNWESTPPAGLDINPDAAVVELVRRLSGARVEIERAGGTITGTLIGLHEEPRGGAGEAWSERSLVLLEAGAVRRLRFDDVLALRFLDGELRDELERALRRRLESLRPSATTVRFSLAAATGVEAGVRYTLPAAAWKISYRLRARGATLTLAGFAVVDNDSEEDWHELRAAFVRGAPIHFTTDLATARRPHRERIDLVSDSMPGAVEISEGMATLAAAPAGAPRMAKARGAAGAVMAASDSLEFEPATAREVGDFEVFEAPQPLSLQKGRSAAVPLFELELGVARCVLHYRRREHAERPWRTIDFVNDSKLALGRGVCSVTEDDVFAGTCIVPITKPGGRALLPHALETGVRLQLDDEGIRERRLATRLAAGWCTTRTEQRRQLRYRIANRRDQAFDFVLDHELMLAQATATAELQRRDARTQVPVDALLDGAVRFRFSLAAAEELTLAVVETWVRETQLQISTDQQIDWFFDILLRQQGAFADRPELRQCLDARRQLQELRTDLQHAGEEIARLQARQERLRANIGVAGSDELAARWRHELGQLEERLVALEDQRIPELQGRERSLRQSLQAQLAGLQIEDA